MNSSTSGNVYVAHALMKYIGASGTGCGFKKHDSFAATEWEFCHFQDLDQGVELLRQGRDADQADQLLWEDACRQQDAGLLRFHQSLYCCNACAFTLLAGHTNERHQACSMMALAQTRNTVLLLVSERATQRPVVLANIPYAIRAPDILPLLQRAESK